MNMIGVMTGRKHRYVGLQLLLVLGIHRINSQDICTPDFNRGCGVDVTKELCEKRNCCYKPSFIRRHNCFQNSKPSKPVEVQYPGPLKGFNKGEILPPDAVQLPKQIDEHTDTLLYTGEDQLDPSQALQVANWLEDYLRIAAAGGEGVNWDFSKENVFHAAVKVDKRTFLSEVEFASGTKIQVNLLNQNLLSNVSALIFVEYLTLGRILQQQTSETTKKYENQTSGCPVEVQVIDSATVVSVTAYDENWEEISIALSFSLNNLNKTQIKNEEEEDSRLSCEYFNETSYQWSSTGCIVLGAQQGSITCGCNHTTKFSVLFVVQPLPFAAPPVHSNNIRTLEFVMEGLSIGCLAITFLSLVLVLQRRSKALTSSAVRAKERTIVHVNFVVALAVLHLVSLVSDVVREVDAFCAAMVVLTHYFMLASGMWMLIEGIVIYLNVIVKSMKHTKLGWYKFAVGWGIPMIIIIISTGIGFSQGTYIQREENNDFKCSLSNGEVEKFMMLPGGYKHCWLSIESNMIWSATGPLLVIFIVNLCILAHTVTFILHLSIKSDTLKPSSYQSQHGKHIWKTTKGVLVLFPILGVPWLIGYLVNIKQFHVSLAFRYIHVILNGLQGVFIFILYCAVNKEVKEVVSRVATNQWQQHKLSLSRSANNSTTTPKERFKKSISSILGNNSPAAYKPTGFPPRAGSQISQQSCCTQHRRSSASGSANSTIFRHKRKYSTISTELCRTMPRSSLGYCDSLPRGLGYKPAHQVTRTPSTKSLRSDNSRNNSIPRLCPICGVLYKLCRHEGVAWLNADTRELIFPSDSHDGVASELPAFNSRWHRMTAEEFKRFSSIPEEKRRSGVNSFILESSEGISNSAHAWDKKSKTIERTNISESYGNKYSVPVEIHFNDDNQKTSDCSKASRSATVTHDKMLENRADTTKDVVESNACSRKTTCPEAKQIKRETQDDVMIHKLLTTATKVGAAANKYRFSMPTPPKSKRKSNRMSGYSEQLIKAVEKWKAEQDKLKASK